MTGGESGNKDVTFAIIQLILGILGYDNFQQLGGADANMFDVGGGGVEKGVKR